MKRISGLAFLLLISTFCFTAFAGNGILSNTRATGNCGTFSLPPEFDTHTQKRLAVQKMLKQIAYVQRHAPTVRTGVYKYIHGLPLQIVTDGILPHAPVLLNMPKHIFDLIQSTLRGSNRLLKELTQELAFYKQKLQELNDQLSSHRSQHPTPDADTPNKIKDLETTLQRYDALIKNVTAEIDTIEKYQAAYAQFSEIPTQLMRLNKLLFNWATQLREHLPDDAKLQKEMPRMDRLQTDPDPDIALMSKDWSDLRDQMGQFLKTHLSDVKRLQQNPDFVLRIFGRLEPAKADESPEATRTRHIATLRKELKIPKLDTAERVYDAVYETWINDAIRLVQLETDLQNKWRERGIRLVENFKTWVHEQIASQVETHAARYALGGDSTDAKLDAAFLHLWIDLETHLLDMSKLYEWMDTLAPKDWKGKYKVFMDAYDQGDSTSHLALSKETLATVLYLHTLAQKPFALIDMLTRNKTYQASDPLVLREVQAFYQLISEVRKALSHLNKKGDDAETFSNAFPNLTPARIQDVLGSLTESDFLNNLPRKQLDIPAYLYAYVEDHLPHIFLRFRQHAQIILDTDIDPDNVYRPTFFQDNPHYPSHKAGEVEDHHLMLVQDLLNVITTSNVIQALSQSEETVASLKTLVSLQSSNRLLHTIDQLEQQLLDISNMTRLGEHRDAADGHNNHPLTQQTIQSVMRASFRRFHPGIAVPDGVDTIVFWLHGMGAAVSRVTTLGPAIEMTGSFGRQRGNAPPSVYGIGLSGPRHGGTDDVHSLADYIQHLYDQIAPYREHYRVGISGRSAGASVGMELMLQHPDLLHFSFLYSGVLPRGYPQGIPLERILSEADIERLRSGEIHWRRPDGSLHTYTLEDIAYERDGKWYIDQNGYNTWALLTDPYLRSIVSYNHTNFADHLLGQQGWMNAFLANPERMRPLPPTLMVWGWNDTEYTPILPHLSDPLLRLRDSGFSNLHVGIFADTPHQLMNPLDNPGFRSVSQVFSHLLDAEERFSFEHFVDEHGNVIDPLSIPTYIRLRDGE